MLKEQQKTGLSSSLPKRKQINKVSEARRSLRNKDVWGYYIQLKNILSSLNLWGFAHIKKGTAQICSLYVRQQAPTCCDYVTL